MGNWDMCDCCGEVEVDLDLYPDGVCSECAGVTNEETMEYYGGVIVDDIGYRSCECEDYPCCGH